MKRNAATMTTACVFRIGMPRMSIRPCSASIVGVGLDPLAIQAAHAVRDEERCPDGGDERDEARRASQRTVGDPLQHDGDDGRRQHGDGEDDGQCDDGVLVDEAGVAEVVGHEEGRHGAGHEHVAMREVDHEQHAVDERVAEGDERVDASLSDAVDDQVAPVGPLEGALSQGGVRADRHEDDDGDAQAPQDQIDKRQSLREVGCASATRECALVDDVARGWAEDGPPARCAVSDEGTTTRARVVYTCSKTPCSSCATETNSEPQSPNSSHVSVPVRPGKSVRPRTYSLSAVRGIQSVPSASVRPTASTASAMML